MLRIFAAVIRSMVGGRLARRLMVSGAVSMASSWGELDSGGWLAVWVRRLGGHGGLEGIATQIDQPDLAV